MVQWRIGGRRPAAPGYVHSRGQGPIGLLRSDDVRPFYGGTHTYKNAKKAARDIFDRYKQGSQFLVMSSGPLHNDSSCRHWVLVVIGLAAYDITVYESRLLEHAKLPVDMPHLQNLVQELLGAASPRM